MEEKLPEPVQAVTEEVEKIAQQADETVATETKRDDVIATNYDVSSDESEDDCHGNPMVTGFSENISDVELYQDSESEGKVFKFEINCVKYF